MALHYAVLINEPLGGLPAAPQLSLKRLRGRPYIWKL